MNENAEDASSTAKLRSGVDAALLRQLGDATTAIFLLRGYEKFGLTERVCYHFDLTEIQDWTRDTNEQAETTSTNTTTPTPTTSLAKDSPSSSPPSSRAQQQQSSLPTPITCGVAHLLECAPATPWHRLSKRQKRALKTQLRAFNATAEAVHKSRTQADILCYQPKQLPLRLSPSTRIFYAYEVTRIAFCVDASPSMTATFGVNGSCALATSNTFGGPCCPLDRLPEMARTFFTSLAEPIPAPSLSGTAVWRPILAVTVLAVFPLGTTAETSLLVRDFRVDSVESAQLLADHIQTWIHAEVEVGISERLNRRNAYSTWSMPLYSSSLRDILEAGDYALSVLSSDARPIIVVATDGRSVSCDGVVDVFLDVDRVDIPVIVLDVSLPETHWTAGDATETAPTTTTAKTEWNFLTYDPGGPAEFPLHLSDDTELLYGVCRATGGYMLDYHMLQEKAKSVAAQQAPLETPTAAHHFSYKRKFVKMNGIQWLTLFSLSPLSPAVHSSSGKLAPPHYLQRHLSNGTSDIGISTDALNFSRHDSVMRQQPEWRRIDSPTPFSSSTKKNPHLPTRVTFSTYFVSPVRIKALLVMRIKEGYRAKHYAISSTDADKVFIQFTLPLDLGIALHYELSYKALAGQSLVVGSAHIKIELSGDAAFVQTVKNDFLRQGSEIRPNTMAQKVSARLCQVMRWIRQEDILQSYLSPPSQWTDQLASPESPFARRLGTMTTIQRRRHFRSDEFDVICKGRMPYLSEEDDFLSEFASYDNGEQELFDLIQEWSTQVVNKDELRFVRAKTDANGTTSYCLIDARQSQIAPRLFTITLEFFGGTDPRERLHILADLKNIIQKGKDIEVLGKQMGPFLLGTSYGPLKKNRNVEFEYHHARWDLVKDPELLPLLMKRRTEIGRFRLMQSDERSAIFAKVVPEKIHDVPGDLIQYQIAILPDKVVVDLHMESECGLFFPFGMNGGETKRFNGMVHVLRRRDQECGRALRSRTNLLRVFQTTSQDPENNVDAIQEPHKESVERILQYSSKIARKIRFFHPSAAGANQVLCRITENLILSGSFGVSSAKLSIERNGKVKELDEGLWFVLQFDRSTMSIAHLSLSDRVDDKDGQAYRNLTCFTSGISDLYSKRDDANDDDSVDSHISEHMCVTEFIDQFEIAERENFAVAAYLALRNDFSAIERFEKDDFAMVLTSLQFVEVANVMVAGQGDDSTVDTESKLIRLIQTIFSPVPGDEECLFYSGGELLEETFSISDDDSESLDADVLSADGSIDRDHGVDQETSNIPMRSPSDDDSGLERTRARSSLSTPPIFVRFKVDGVVVPFKSLNRIDKTSSLTAEVSVSVSKSRRYQAMSSTFGGTEVSVLPWSHQAVISELNILLKWYVAEQTIEKLRHQGSEISQENLNLVKKCMKRVQSTLSFSIEVFFYVSKTDLMVPASAPAGSESQVIEGFALLHDELCKNEVYRFTPVASGGYYVSVPMEGNSALPFWCFLYVQTNEGLVSSQIYHPEGEHVAVEVMSKINASIRNCIHRVNQQLLLTSLHRNRTASSLLIPSPKKKITIAPPKQEEKDEENKQTFGPGVFACPVVFRTLFKLFHRCATNPNQVARTLEATVLHSFAVSNRSGIFVYKDEVGEIFYMSLEARGSGIDGDGQVELLVHGINKPGPSVTEQLKVLLQRRLLLIAVEMLSSVLTKNPHFRVGAADLDFLRSFDHHWMNLANDKDRPGEREQYYEFPDVVADPCMVVLMFRQNICGSTFFHRLNDIGYERLSPSVTQSRRLESGGSILKWNEHDFTLYYNNAPSKLDQSFQGVSTLTERGATLSRQVGSGIAMVEILLIRANGTPVDEVAFGRPIASTYDVSNCEVSKLRFRKLERFPDPSSDRICVRVRITDTALSRKHLHEWIELSLNQSLIAWIIERGIERASKLGPVALKKDHDYQDVAQLDGKELIEAICPGLPSLQYMLESSHDLPHPGISRLVNSGMIRSSTVATKTLKMLETCILGTLFKDSTSSEAWTKANVGFHIIRKSRSSLPEVVKLSWDPSSKRAVVQATRTSQSVQDRAIQDSPIDCPEYICFFQLSAFGGIASGMDPYHKLSREVMIHDGISDSSATIELLETLKAENRDAFMRSFAFVFSVKRNKRTLYTYNWTPSLVESVSSRLKELEHTSLEEAGLSAHNLQYRSLRLLSPPSKARNTNEETQRSNPAMPNSTAVISKKETRAPEREEPPVGTMPARRIRRPVMIRRPKLVGKSVDGAAMQAVAASRKRASSNQFKNVANNVPVRRSSAVTPTKESGRATIAKIASSQSDTSSKGSGRPPIVARYQKDDQYEDEDLSRLKADYQMACRQQVWCLRRPSSILRDSTLLLANLWWPMPRKQEKSLPLSVAQFIMSRSPISWRDSCRCPPLPGGMVDDFIPIFARWISTLSPGLELLSTNIAMSRSKAVLLASHVKNVRGRKCLVVVEISKGSEKKSPCIIRCQGWVCVLPRRSRRDQMMKRHANVVSATFLEKDSTGLDKLSSDIRRSLALESLLIDFSSSMVERAVRLSDDRIEKGDLVPTLFNLMARYSLSHQKRIPMLNYRTFIARVVLKSFGNRLINKFDSITLLNGLHMEAEERDLIPCGTSLCFKRGVNVKGSHSICFLTQDPLEKTCMRIVILCRTQGRNLSDFMFREGSNIAIHILDHIVLEAAGLVYKELASVAEKLHKETIWKSLSTRTTRLRKSQEYIEEMLHLCSVRSILQTLGNNTRDGAPQILSTLLGPDSGIDWKACCRSMKKERSFGPSWSINGAKHDTHIFFMELCNTFLCLELGTDGNLQRADIIEKDENTNNSTRQLTVQVFSNFLLHYLWQWL